MRLRRLREEFAGSLDLEWRSFLLRPRAGDVPRDLARFREYTKSWMRPAADDDAPTFRVWATEEGPPTHSVPAHVVAKAAATLGEAEFEAMHTRLLQAYFGENRDISSVETLLALWREAGLPEAEFARASDRKLVEAVARDHNEAVELGVNGVPAVRVANNSVPVVGAQPIDVYRRWIRKVLETGGTGA